MKTPDSSPDKPDDAWDDLFRQQLRDYTDQPPVNALNRILAGTTPPRPTGHWAVVSLAVLLLLGTGGWLFVRKYTMMSKSVAGVVHRLNAIAKKDTLSAERTTVRRVSSAKEPPLSVTDGLSGPITSGEPKNLVVSGHKPARIHQLPASAGLVTKTHFVTQINDKWEVHRRAVAAADRLPDLGRLNADKTEGQPLTKADLGQPHLKPAKERARRNQADRAAPGGSTAKALAGQSVDSPAALTPQPTRQLQPVALLAGRPFRAFVATTALPGVSAGEPVTGPQASQTPRRPAWLVMLTPLYTYQRIDPIHTDAERVSDIQVARSLAANRLGGRLQLGMEWPLTNRIGLRTSLVYQQVRQSLRYAVQSTRPDSVQVVVVSDQSVQITPVFTRQDYAETAIWHYAGVSTDIVWQLNRTANARWQHYLTAGATVGRYVSRGGNLNGFIQAAYGIERPLTVGLRLRIEPTMQWGWQALTDKANRFQSRPYSYGLALALHF